MLRNLTGLRVRVRTADRFGQVILPAGATAQLSASLAPSNPYVLPDGQEIDVMEASIRGIHGLPPVQRGTLHVVSPDVLAYAYMTGRNDCVSPGALIPYAEEDECRYLYRLARIVYA